MKRISIALAIFAALSLTVSCDKQLDVVNPNNQTTYDFGNTEADLNEAIISCYNRIRLEGTFSRVGNTMDAVRGDEVWNSSQIWYLNYDNLNAPNSGEVATYGGLWIWRDAFHVVNRCNFVISKVEGVDEKTKQTDPYKQILGQALFLRGLAYYHLATYYQNVPLYTKYEDYSSLETIYAPCAPQDTVFNQIDKDLVAAMELLPSRDAGGEWAKGRATCGAAAGYYARSLMFRHRFKEALEVLEAIIAGTYGHYQLMADYGDNFREGTAYENNAESLFEVQFLDYGMGGTDEEWTPVNISKNSTQGHAVESNYGSGELGSWGDLAISPWLYNLFKAEKCTDNRLDPRLYWTAGTYEPEYDTYTGIITDAYPKGDPRSNVLYMNEITKTPLANPQNGGISITKFTNARNNVYSTITTGLHCGVNLRLMRYSDVLLRAAECENEVNGPTEKAINWINEVRTRVALPKLNHEDFAGNADKLFEQIANVERPKEFGCENGRGVDLIRWGFFYDDGRLNQIKQHSCYMLDGTASTVELTTETASDYSYKYYTKGHEYFPIYQGTLNANPNLTGNSANTNTDNGEAFRAKGWTVRPVVAL